MKQGEMPGIVESIGEAEMVLVGLGEEFDGIRRFRRDEVYIRGKELLAESGEGALIPLWQEFFRKPQAQDGIRTGLDALAELLRGKNYFVVSVSTNSEIEEAPWREGRLVMPCGSARRLQCSHSCGENLRMAGDGEIKMLMGQFADWGQSIGRGEPDRLPAGFGCCSVCGETLTPNNVYGGNYDEDGYLAQWADYMKWLQGTLNRRLVVLELGVGMQFPSVIRFPFEKVAYFNQKAGFYRINENLYQMTEELATKGTGIAKNAIDWLQNLC